jgi:Pregnancy-associated plasma protein-A/Secretion system C-terminal sorting domain
MRKNYFLLLLSVMLFSGRSFAQLKQPCYTDEIHRRVLANNPNLAKVEQDYEKQIQAGLKQIDLTKYARTTASRTDYTDSTDFWYDVPVVIHVIHDYNYFDPGDSEGAYNDLAGDYAEDSVIYNAIDWFNIVYAKENGDTSSVIHTYKGFIPNSQTPYIGTIKIRLHLASVDPNGNPTHGITHHRSYLTYSGGDQAKFDQWPPTSYLNIWTIGEMSTSNGQAAAYAYLPPEIGNGVPAQYDGVISITGYFNYTTTINHEIGHVFNLYHPWGSTNAPAVACGDDFVDDTPPTEGHAETGCSAASLYDTMCATNYFKIYGGAHGDSLVNYPDTVNAQNIMDYTYCGRMFTAGQAARMHAALNSDVAGRNNLWDTTNLMRTGVWDASYNPIPRADLPPIVEFSVVDSTSSAKVLTNLNIQYFTCPPSGGKPYGLKFYNESWNDTIIATQWTFSNGASRPTSNKKAVSETFTEPGWVTVTLASTGNGTGTTSDTSTPVFVAQATGTTANGYFEEFSGADTAQWPTFNYYSNEFKWQLSNSVGFYDHSSMEYLGFDNRISSFGVPLTGLPAGDFDDMFSIPMDLSGLTSGNCYLNYMYSGASRSSNSADINDELDIDYSVDRSNTWTNIVKLTKHQVFNNGVYTVAYYPTSTADWAPMAISIPAAARTNYTVFRFRYKPGIAVGYDGTTATGTMSSGNNFFIDRINFSPYPASVSTVKAENGNVVVAPNPTNGDAYVIINDANSATARVVVTDITGKVVYTTTEEINAGQAHVQIPHSAIAVAGMYIVQTTTGDAISTRKLVVE